MNLLQYKREISSALILALPQDPKTSLTCPRLFHRQSTRRDEIRENNFSEWLKPADIVELDIFLLYNIRTALLKVTNNLDTN